MVTSDTTGTGTSSGQWTLRYYYSSSDSEALLVKNQPAGGCAEIFTRGQGHGFAGKMNKLAHSSQLTAHSSQLGFYIFEFMNAISRYTHHVLSWT